MQQVDYAHEFEMHPLLLVIQVIVLLALSQALGLLKCVLRRVGVQDDDPLFAEAPLSRFGSGPQAKLKQERIMSDLIYIGLGVFLFVLVSAYARACGRL